MAIHANGHCRLDGPSVSKSDGPPDGLGSIAAETAPPVMELMVQEANTPAVAPYRSMGLEIVEERMREPVEEFPAEPEYRMVRTMKGA
jgi:ribosomal protein S18 acetylase RimI-like enzyme